MKWLLENKIVNTEAIVFVLLAALEMHAKPYEKSEYGI